MFYGAKDIGKVKVVVGRYRQPGYDRDGKITLISSQDTGLAQAAVSNYVSNFKEENPFLLPGNVSLVAEVKIGNHDAIEFKDIVDNNTIKYSYLWSSGNLVAFVEGSPDKEKSIAFAETVKI
jgi:hypothetical protein